MATLQELAEMAEACVLTKTDVEAYASAQGSSTNTAYDALALHLASGYAARELSFEFCDAAMNFVMGLTTYNVPELAWSVYSAFDEGEFHHSGDGRDVDPAEKYTRPWIERIIAVALANGGAA